MGGSFLADMRSLRKAGHNLPHIVSFFLKKDVEKRQETRRLTRLLADAKVGFIQLLYPIYNGTFLTF